MRNWMVFLVLGMGCGSPILPASKDTESDSGSPTELPSDGGDEEGETPAPLENPSVQYASAVCLEDSTAFWKLELVASDPQGINTLESAKCEIYPAGIDGAERTWEVPMECDGTGRCGQNYDGEDEGVLCSEASSWEFHFTIMDEDGYLSTVEVVTGTAD